MAAFDRYYVPGVSASVDSVDNEIGLVAPFYDGSLEPDWVNVGTNTRLQTVDSVVVSWNTAAAGTSSRRLDLSTWVRETSGESMPTDVPANLTVTGVSLTATGTIDVVSIDTTTCSLFSGIRQQAAGGIFSPPTAMSYPQFFGDSIVNNGGTGAGTYSYSSEIISGETRAGLSQSDILTVLRSSSMLVRLFFSNDTSTVFTLKIDQIKLRVVGTTPSGGRSPRGRSSVRLRGR